MLSSLCARGFCDQYIAARITFGMVAVGSLMVGAAGAAELPYVVNNTELMRLPAARYSMVSRLGLEKPGDVPPLLFLSNPAPCRQRGGAGDLGSCVRAGDGGSWRALYPGNLDARQFGVRPGEPADNVAGLHNALLAADDGVAGAVRCVHLAGYGANTKSR